MKGSYQVGPRVERFSCGAGPAGWRYTATDSLGDTVDLTVDNDGRVRRLLAAFDGWQVRGGSVGADVLWVRAGQEHSSVALGFTGSSPGFELATARLLCLPVGQSRRVTLVELTEPVGAGRTVRREWTRAAGPEPDVDRYEVSDLDTGERTLLHLSDQVLVSRDGPDPAYLLTLTG